MVLFLSLTKQYIFRARQKIQAIKNTLEPNSSSISNPGSPCTPPLICTPHPSSHLCPTASLCHSALSQGRRCSLQLLTSPVPALRHWA